MNTKERYRQFCESSSKPLIFQTPLWLDTVAGEGNWDVVLTFQGDHLSGAFPFVTSKKYGLHQITLPILTFYLGPLVLFPSDLSEENKLSFKRKVLSQLEEQLPKTDRFITQTDFNFDYWLPFYWKGYQQTIRYTFLMDTEKPLDAIYSGFKPNIKKLIKKAEGNFTISLGDSPEEIYTLYKTDYERKNIKISFSKNDIIKIDNALSPANRRIILQASDSTGNVIAAYYILIDHQYMHYIFGAVEHSQRNSGVMSLLMWEAIQLAKKNNLKFNFGGSMNKNIEQFFSGFRGALTPYMRISKVNNKWMKQFALFEHKN